MTFLPYEWLGYAATPDDAIRMIRQTGQFYIAIAIAYFLSVLYMLCCSPGAIRVKKNHGLMIALWGVMGTCLTLFPLPFSLFFNAFIIGLSLLVLYQLQFTSSLATQVTLTELSEKTDHKKALYAQAFLKKMKYTITDILSISLINEQILWILILYRSLITLRVSWGL